MNENRVNSRVCLSVSARWLPPCSARRPTPQSRLQGPIHCRPHPSRRASGEFIYIGEHISFANKRVCWRNTQWQIRYCELTCQGDFCALRASPVGDVLPPALRFQKRVMCDSRALAASNNSVRTISSLPSVILPMMSFSPDWYIFGVSPDSAPASLPSCRPGTRARITQSLRPEERRTFSIGMAVNEREALRPALWWPCARDRLVRTGR